MSAKRLLLVHAHPDDESINNGATMAAYSAAGVEVTLVTCTRGEEGEVLIPELAHLGAAHDDSLGEHRTVELANAMQLLGVKDHRFLGGGFRKYRDSGMMGTESNSRPDVFWNADFSQAVSDLVQVIDEVRPQVMITYDEFGGYGHPDHIQAHRVAMAAAKQSDWKIQKIYWNGTPKSVIARAMEKLAEFGQTMFGSNSVDDVPWAKPDEQITSVVVAPDFSEAKANALRAHATQITEDGPFFALSNAIGPEVFGIEYYQLVHGQADAPFDDSGRELDLFAGVSET